MAAWMGHVDVVMELLRLGCDATAVTSRGETVLHYAVRSGQPRLTKLILDASVNASVDSTTFDVRLPSVSVTITT